MENLLSKEPVKRVQEFIDQFDPKLKVTTKVIDNTASNSKRCSRILWVVR